MNVSVQVVVWISVFNSLGCISTRGIIGSYGNFWGMARLFSTEKAPFYVPTSKAVFEGPNSPHPCQPLLFSIFLTIVIPGVWSIISLRLWLAFGWGLIWWASVASLSLILIHLQSSEKVDLYIFSKCSHCFGGWRFVERLTPPFQKCPGPGWLPGRQHASHCHHHPVLGSFLQQPESNSIIGKGRNKLEVSSARRFSNS